MSGDPYIRENDELRAEIARLQHWREDANQWEQTATVLKAEIAKLRAALEEMSTYPVAGDAMVMLDIAREALAKEGEMTRDHTNELHEYEALKAAREMAAQDTSAALERVAKELTRRRENASRSRRIVPGRG